MYAAAKEAPEAALHTANQATRLTIEATRPRPSLAWVVGVEAALVLQSSHPSRPPRAEPGLAKASCSV